MGTLRRLVRMVRTLVGICALADAKRAVRAAREKGVAR